MRALLLLSIVACSAPAPLPELARAERAERAGRTDEALAQYRAAQKTCTGIKGERRRREICGQALVGEASLLADSGRTDEAIRAFAAIPERAGGDPPPSAQGLFRAGQLALERAEAKTPPDDREVAQAWNLLWRTVTEYPDEAFAGDAIELLVRDGRGRDARALYDELGKLGGALDDTKVADNLLWAMADLAEHELHDPAAARALYDRIDEDHKDSGLRDDAYWRAANLSRAIGDPQGAVTRLRTFLATREVAFGAGSYFSIWLDDAQLLLGQILRDDLHDNAGAATAFRQLPELYPASILRDDALIELAETLAASGDAKGACDALAKLKHDWPDSKFLTERAPAVANKAACKP
ncbi:MAG TPA: tetratricopeptide repeat protein [Kofleriaceae bacterium]|nr:tetratricopeptide repeat protein [Kofleriaceae bacterium]